MTKSKDDAPEMFDIESVYIDTDAIDEGRWLPLGADFPGVQIQTRGLSSKPAKTLMAHLHRTAPRSDMSGGKLTAEADDRITRTVVARKCLMDWKGLSSGGEPLPFSVETAEKLMLETRARLFAAAVINAIVDLEKTRASQTEAVAGNLPAS